VRQEATDVAALCGSEVTVTALVADAGPNMKRAIATAGNLVVSTPGESAVLLLHLPTLPHFTHHAA